jgi:hypothetical protein
MVLTAIFMYVWISRKVGNKRRMMKLRLLRRRPGAKDPQSDWRVMYEALAIFGSLAIPGFF